MPHLIKHDVVEELGQRTLLLPDLVNRGLAANGRAKYLLSLLQAARARADAPSQPFSALREERLAAGVAVPELDEVVAGSSRLGPDRYRIPGARGIHRDLLAAIAEMIAPLAAGDGDGDGEREGEYAGRLAALAAAAPSLDDDEVPGTYIDAITRARHGQGDSLHLLVMEAHRALNRLQAEIATTSIDGAAAYALRPDDGPLVAAFMAGLHETSPLKFDHPGLGTTATRAGDRLLVQNDLGTTNAHVVVIAAEGLGVTITYTDVHRRRLCFFTSMLDGFGVQWSGVQERGGSGALGDHHLTVGRYEARDRGELAVFLRHVGSRLVFVLDWNRARKQLGTLVGNDDAEQLLRWAADNNIGHIGFLTLGGTRLVYDAVELSAKVPARYGEPLVDVLGRDALLAVTRFALRAAAEGRLAGKSALLIRDELRVEVLRHVQASHRRLLDASAEHASLVVECARALEAALVRLGTADGAAFLRRAAARAAIWEHRADELLVDQRRAARRVEDGDAVLALTTIADDAIDALEEAVFLLTLLPGDALPVVRPVLEPVAAVAVMTAREHLKALEAACQVVGGAAPEDLEDFLVAVDQVATLEHEADTADRMARAALVNDAPDFRSLYVADSVSRGAESATDALLRSALGLRDHVLSVVSA
ncbi:MAG TPA: hypothetical protein VMU14_12785 [Acidimicrobiales bacterium]|nr:hypothetical protein [Acidimicrobiales bacterium]